MPAVPTVAEPRTRWADARRSATALLFVVALVSSASQAAVVAETHRLGDAPYYVDVGTAPPRGTCAIVLPAAVDPELPGSFGYGDRLDEFEPLVGALNARIGALKGCLRAAGAAPGVRGAPRVYVGSAEGDDAPIDVGDQRLPGDRFAPMVLHLARPGADWRTQVAAILRDDGADHAIVVQLGVSQYMKGYSGAFRKEVVLGTGYRQPIEFMTAEDKPVEVLHLTGALVDAQGRVVRAGAEGIVLRDTPFLAQAFDVTRGFDDEEIARVLVDQRRHDLPGAPLAIDAALDSLLAQLTR